MSDEQDFALKASSEAPWWAKAPIWLSLGIIGVPSLIAIGAGYFLASNVNSRLRALEQSSVATVHQLSEMNNEQDQRWDSILRFMQANMEVQIRTCLHAAKTPKELDECVEVGDHGSTLPKK